MKIFAERLKKLRNDKELSQAKLAKVIGVAQQTIDKWEQDKTEPDMETITRLSIFFDVTADYLIGLTNDISKYDKSTTRNTTKSSEPKIQPQAIPAQGQPYHVRTMARGGQIIDIELTEQEADELREELIKKAKETKGKHKI